MRTLMGRARPCNGCRGAAGPGCFQTAVFLVLAGVAASTSISDRALESNGSTGRSLLQARTSCQLNFELMNYTIITSQCKGPRYPADLCCGAFKEFACPYAEQLNDLTNDCATVMFNYINTNGKYPPGLFSNECRDSKRGLECPANGTQSDPISNGATVVHGVLPLVVLVLWSTFLFI